MSQSNVFYEMSEKSSYHKINFIIKGLGIKIKDMCILKTNILLKKYYISLCSSYELIGVVVWGGQNL